MKLRTLLFISALSLFQGQTFAQTLHVVVFCDTNDPSIGVNKEAERKRTISEMQTIASILDEYGYDSEMSEYFGNNCNKRNLLAAVRGLDVGPEDVVFFYYGGHGARAENDSDPFPQMCLGEDYQENWVPATLIKNIIAKKGPRLAVILTACCNKGDAGVSIKSVVAEAPYTKESNINKEAFKRMFLETRGTVMMTSSKAGQYSYSGPQGGVFCITFWDAMDLVGESKMQPEWNSFCEAVKQAVFQVPIRTNEGIVHQEPYQEVKVNGSGSKVDPTRTTTKVITVNNRTSTLASDINSLLDQTISVDVRLKKIADVKRQHFTDGAKVITVGRNMTTLVDYEDVDVFLRRIVLSPYIKQINIVEGDEAGVKSQIKVHEVRTN